MAGTAVDQAGNEFGAVSDTQLLALIAAAGQLLDAGADPAASDGAGDPPVERALAGLTALRRVRDLLDDWEPALIAAARRGGASWARLAPVLGVASRQAAERRYLRSRQPGREQTGLSREARVRAERDRRAGDRAVTAWARSQGADLRQLAGQITALTNLGPEAQPSLDRLHRALGGADAAELVPLLADTHEHLPAGHAALADRVTAVANHADLVRQATQDGRDLRRAHGETEADAE